MTSEDGSGAIVLFTQRFEADPSSVEQFCVQSGFAAVYERLLLAISGKIIPNLERFPSMGRPVLDVRPDSVEALLEWESLAEDLGDDGSLREYLLEDHVLLYACLGNAVYLLGIRHARQLSPDFEDLWHAGSR